MYQKLNFLFLFIVTLTLIGCNNKNSDNSDTTNPNEGVCSIDDSVCRYSNYTSYAACGTTETSLGNEGIYLLTVKADIELYIDIWKRDGPANKWIEVRKGLVLKKGNQQTCEQLVNTNERLKVEVRASSTPNDRFMLKTCRVSGGYKIGVEFESVPSGVSECEKVRGDPDDDYAEAVFYLKGNFPNVREEN